MSDNPMYWPGHQRPAWHQQSSGGGPPPMNHYGGHPGAQMGGMVPPPPLGPPGSDPNSVQVQSSIPGGRSTGGPQQSQQQPGGPQASQQQSSIYTTMMPPSNQSNSTPGGPSIRPPPQSQLNSTNSHLSSAASSATQQGMPPSGPHQTSMQQQPPTHPQSHYSHQYSSLGPPPYWNPGSMNSQPTPGGGPSGPPPSGPGVQSAPDPYTSASPLTMPNDSRAGPGMSAAATSAFHSPKDMQSSNDHMMSYDRRSGPMSQQHPSSMMSSSVPSSTASNLSPNPSSMRANVGGLHNQPPSMSQQASSWTNSYYGATTNQSPYVNPYMPYGSASMPTNHSSTLTQAPRPPQAMTQKIPVNGADRTRAVYPTHSNMYGQPQPTASSTNGGYYGYDPYYNPVPSQPPPPTPTDPYLSHSSSASSQHWSSQATGNSMISNSSAPPSGPPPPQTILRAPGSNIHPQSPSASSTLPSLPVRPPTQQSQTPDRSPAPPQHTPSYPSPGQAPSSGPKSTSNSLAQLEQMVMPGSGPSNAPSMKSPTHRSSTSSPSTNTQQQMQYSYNSSGQGSYFSSTGSSAPPPPLQSNYYSSYESSGVDVPKPNWSDQSPGMMMPAPGPVMMDSSQSYGQSSYDGSNSYGDYATLSAPNNIQSQYGASSSTAEQPAEKSDPYAIDSQTFDDYDDQTTVSKTKKSRAKKGDDSTKKERKPRASKASKAAATAAAAAAAAAPVEPPQSPVKTNSSVPEQQKTSSTPIPQIVDPSPSHVVASTSTYPSADPASSTSKSISEPPPAPYNQYDSSSNDPTKASWQDPAQSTSLLSHPPAPMLTEMSSHSSYVSPTSYDNSNSFSEYTTLSAPPKVPVTTDQPLVTSGPIETVAVDNNATPDEEIQSQPEKNDEQPAANIKTKKGSSKKGGDEAIKRERKPRPSRAKGVNIPPTSPQDTSSIQDPNTTPTAEDTDQTAPSYPAVDQASVQPQGHAEGLYPGFEGSKYDEYPGTSIIKQPQTDGDSTLPSDVNDPQNNESVATEVGSEPSASKPKKSRAKRSGDRPKREKKPKVAKTPSGSPVVELSTSPTNESQADLSIAESQASQPASEGTTSEAKPKRVRVRDPTKKKLPKFALKFAKTKKRKRLGSSDNDQSDLEKTPPPSPDEAESGVQKRRSARNTRKLKYNEDIGLGFSESDDDDQPASKPKKKSATTSTNADGETTAAEETVIMDEPTVFAAPVEDTMVVEKIMTSRTGRRELEPEPGEILPPDGTHIDVEEFYVKYKNLSYLHCDWRTLEELEKGDRRVAQKIKRWKQKKDSSNVFSFMDEDLFDPQYCEADRILAVNEVEEMVPDEDDEDEDKNNDKGKAIAIEGQDIEKSSMEIDESQAKVKPEQSTQEAPMEVDETSKDSNKIPDDDKLVSTADEPDTKADAKADEKVIKTSTETEVAEKEDNPESARPETDKLEVTNGEVDEAKTSDQPTAGAEDDPSKEESNAIQIVDEAPTNGPVAEENQVENPRKMKKKISRHYLVKWRGLSYEDSTWELEEVLDPDKIKQFERFKDPPPKSKWKTVKRPKPDEWVRKEQSPVYKNNNTLREYQLEGINWLSFCWHQGRNCILADEMGLGKTIQSIAFINEIFQYGIYGPFLIIVPLSTVGNWAREFETWTDMNVITYHGSSTSREMLKEYEMFYRNEAGNRITNYYKFQVMITTFEIILSDCLDLMKIPWRCCIIDEAHRLKNRNCKLLEGLRLLNMEHRVLLTGTPLQNNVEELFSLLNFLEPTQFSSTEQFLQEFGDLKTEAQVDKLKLILKPMMLRRLKEDVEKTLAPKEETIVEVELTNIQKKYYRAILEKNFSFLSKGTSSNNMPNLMNTMMELRKCCIHPYLINGAEEQILYEAKQTKLAGGEPMSSQQAMINSSGKLVLIDKLLPRLRADGHRVLIFSQMVRCLDILEDYVTHKHYPYERIDGRVRGSERQQAIDRYSKPGSDRFVFLLCTRAGGLGINLTAADTVIIFDSDWNPQNDLQAQARCHRIGQSKAVKIYRLICRNTYEREMFDKASLKLGLDKAVLQSMNTQKGGPGGVDGQLTKKEIEELLRKGAYGALMDDDNAGDKFCEEDIDQILQRRTQVITIDNSEAKGSTFSKATFSSSNNREDIELDDPNFWEKWAKKANIDSDDARTKEELIQLAPRRRTQTKRYGADGNLIDISDLESSEEDEETISMRTRGGRSGRSTKPTPGSASKRSKRNKYGDFDEDLATVHDGGYWSKSDCLKVETGLLTYGWGRWEEIIATGNFKRPLTPEDCESICRVILLYCLNSYKGDEKIKSSAWELILPPENSSKSESDSDATITTRGRKPKTAPIPTKKTVAEEIADAKWTKEAKNDPLIALPDDQYRRHLQRNCNKLLIRVKFLHYLRNDILRDQTDKILADCNVNEVDLLPCAVDGDLPASWWDDEADKSLLVGIFKHGHDRFNLIRQDPNLCFLHRCGPPNQEDLMKELLRSNKNADYFDDDVYGNSRAVAALLKSSVEGEVLDGILNNVVKDIGESNNVPTTDILDENKNTILKAQDQDETMESCENGVSEIQTKMEITDDESSMNDTSIDATIQESADLSIPEVDSNDLMLFPSANDLNQRFRRLITAHQRNSKKLEIKMAQKARDELKKERTSKFEAAKNEREERKRSLAQKWSRREESDFSKAVSFFGVEYMSDKKKHDWNKFRSIGKLDKKLDETLEEYYKAFVIMCKKVTSKPLTNVEEKCPINVEAIPEDRASKCLSRIDFFSRIREQTMTHPELDQRLQLCQSQSDLPDWWENGKHDKDLLIAACKHGLYRLDYNLAHDSSLSFDDVIKQKVEAFFKAPPTSILIALEQLQELLDRNGIEYIKDLDLHDNSEDVKGVIESLLDAVENEELDGTNEKDKSLLPQTRTPPKSTRSSAALSGFSSRPLPNILSRRGANTLVKSEENSGTTSLRLTSNGDNLRYDDRRVVEVTPILPDKMPAELKKTHEAGEVTITIQSESAMLRLDDRDPIILFGASHPITIKIRWPKDKAIQTRLDNLMHLVENNEWPSPPKPSVPTITLPNHLAPTTTAPSTPLSVTTSPPKGDKMDQSLGSPKSDVSAISSKTSKQETKEANSEVVSSLRGKRGRRKTKPEPAPKEPEHPVEDRQAAAKLRNLLSQGTSSNNKNSDRSSSKFGGKQAPGLSSLLAPSKTRRSDANAAAATSAAAAVATATTAPTASTGSINTLGTSTLTAGMPNQRPDLDLKSLLNLSAPGMANLLPQILANMKPEFRDLLSNPDSAQMILNSLSSMTGTGGLGTNLRSNANLPMTSGPSNTSQTRSSSKSGPPPAHSGAPPSAHGGSGGQSARELRRSFQHLRENSPPSINLRSTRGKVSMPSTDTSAHQKPMEMAHGKTAGGGSGSTSSTSKKRGRPSSRTSDSPPGGVSAADILDLSSLPPSLRGAAALQRAANDSRSRRNRDQGDDSLANILTRASSSGGTTSKSSPKSSSKAHGSSSQKSQEPTSPDKGVRTTRASKRIGSRIDALALNLQAKRMHRSDSPGLSPTLPKDSPQVAHGSVNKHSQEHKSRSPKVPPPAAHSGFHKSSSSSQEQQQTGAKQHSTTSSQSHIPTTTTPLPQAQPSTSLGQQQRQDPLAQLMNNSASLLAGLNPATLGNAGDFINQLLRKAGSNDMVKNLMNELIKNPSLALDPNILGALTALPMASQALPGFPLPTSTPTIPTSLPPTSMSNPGKNTPGSLLNDFKPPSSGGNSSSKRSRHDTSSSRHSNIGSHANLTNEGNRRSSSSSSSATTATTAVPTTAPGGNMFFRNAQQQAANAALANSLMNLASQPNSAANPYNNYTNPLANPFLPFGLGNLGLNNPLGMAGLFPNLYLPGFQTPNTSQQQQSSNQQSGNPTDGQAPKDKKMRYPRK